MPWQDADKGIPFGGIQHKPAARIVQAAANIRTFTEQFSDEPLRREIQSAFAEAALVVFLGFGFHKQNMELLQMPLADERYLPVFATKQGIDEANDWRIRVRIASALRTNIQAVDLFDMAAQQMLTRLNPSIVELVG